MKPETFAEKIKAYLEPLELNSTFGDWTLTHKLDVSNYRSFRFQKGDARFQLGIEDNPAHPYLHLYQIFNKNTRQGVYHMMLKNPKVFRDKQEESILFESYEVGNKYKGLSAAKAKEIFIKQGQNDNTIASINDETPYWDKLISNLLDWCLVRLSVKSEYNRTFDGVIALMAADGTDWKHHYIEQMEGHDACILWNSKRPSGTNETLNYLRAIIEEGNTFNLYYSSGGQVRFKATIADFAESQDELDNKAWDKRYENIFGYKSTFDAYIDENKKASILFLAEDFVEIKPIPVGDFKFHNGYSAPTQDNLSPVRYEPNSIIVKAGTIGIDELGDKDKNKNILNQILFGPPGTGKTYNTINKAVAIANPNFDLTKPRDEVKAEFDRLKKEGQIEFITFHQSMSYEDFVEGIKPDTVSGGVIYEIEDGIFKQLCDSAKLTGSTNFDAAYNSLLTEIENADEGMLEIKTPKGTPFWVSVNSKSNLTLRTGSEKKPQGTLVKTSLQKEAIGEKFFNWWKGYAAGVINHLKDKHQFKPENTGIANNYVLIIDEINRGNVSQIFGELITLIEEDKRLGSKKEDLEIKLPYSKKLFGVPPNLYIIGTMNTADRSVEALDTALRRRFSFEEMPPKAELIRTNGKLKESNGRLNGWDLADLLNTLNKRIERLLDKDHLIGHSYFMTVGSVDELKWAFQHKIIPLLQEYFFGDYGKMGLVIGKGFFEENMEEVPQTDKLFADMGNEYNPMDYATKRIYKLKDISKMDFNSAIELLFNK